MISHPDFGGIKYLKTYLLLDKTEDPELFICKFENSEDKYLGRMVEEYHHPNLSKTLVKNFYFVGVNESEIKLLENKYEMLEHFFSTRPVWFLNYLKGSKDNISRWKKESKINPIYQEIE